MWQRKQTIFLAIVAILMIVCCITELQQMVLPCGSAIVCAHSVKTILTYKDRKKQMTQCRIGILACLVLIGLFAFYYWDELQTMGNIPAYPCLCLVSAILYEMAYKGVKHDDDLVRSADRIR